VDQHYIIIIGLLVTLMSGMAGWIMRSIFETWAGRTREEAQLRLDIDGIKVQIAGELVSRVDLEKVESGFTLRMNRMEEQLTGKVDR